MARSLPAENDLAADVADLLHQVNHRLRRAVMAEADSSGVTSAQGRAMRTLVHHDGPMRMSELAAALGIVRRSATSVVDDLEQLGFVRRVDDPADRRAVDVELTPAGRNAMTEARRRRRSAAAEVLAGLGDAELQTLRELLQRLRS